MKVEKQSFRWLVAELLVVVLGILIAFQIDGWNTERLERKQEVAGLEAILRDLEVGQREFELYIETIEDGRARHLQLLELLSEDREPPAEEIIELARLRGHRLWQPTATAFNGLRDTGRLDLIEDDELQRALVDYFDTFEPYFLDMRLYYGEERDLVAAALDADFDLVPAPDYAETGDVRRRLRVPPTAWPTDTDLRTRLVRLDQRAARMREIADLGMSGIVDLRNSIEEYLSSM